MAEHTDTKRGDEGGGPHRRLRMPSLPRAAEWYAKNGWPVFPVWGICEGRCGCGRTECQHPGKHPIGSLVPNGVKNATTDAAVVRGWWTAQPDANIGVATGANAGLLVLDIDGPEGLHAVADLEKVHSALPTTVESITGGGGRHRFFTFSEGVRNRVRFAPGLDTRTTGGYVIAPPSRHASGRSYEWSPAQGPHETTLAPAPDWLLSLMGGKPLNRRAEHVDEEGGGEGETEPPGKVSRGARNSFLASEGGRLRHLRLTEAAIRAALGEINREQCDPPLPDAEVGKIAQSVARYAPGPAPAEWEPPVPFVDPQLPRFPVEVLPPWLGAWVGAVSVATQTPPDLAGLLALAVIGLGVAKKLAVQVKERWIEPLNIYVVIALPPGDGKSPVFKHATHPVRAFEKEERKRMAPIIEAAEVEFQIAKKRVEDLQRKAVGAKPDDTQTAIDAAKTAAAQLASLRAPVTPRIIADDITAEALAILLRDQGGRLGVFSAEGGPFELMAGRYSDSAPNFELYLKAHSGDYFAVDRVSRSGGFIESPALTLGLTVQPEVIAGLASNKGFRGRGLLARFLYGMPRSWAGHRDPDPPEVLDAYWDDYTCAIDVLLQFKGRTDAVGEYEPITIRLSTEAYQVLVAFKAENEPRLGPDGDLGALGDWMNKIAGAAVRIAGLLHVADRAGARGLLDEVLGEIDADTMRRAVVIARYLIPHAAAAFDLMGSDEGVESAKFVLAAILRSGKSRISQREILRAVQSRIRRVADLEPVLDVIEGRGFIRQVPRQQGAGPGRPGREYDVNPLTRAAPEPVTEMTESADGGDSVNSVTTSQEPGDEGSTQDDMVEGVA